VNVLLLCLALSPDEAPRPDTVAAIHETVTALSELSLAGDLDEARALLDEHVAAISAASDPTWSERWTRDPAATMEERALLTYARGVIEMQAGVLDAAAAAFEGARAQAGPGELRLNSIYNLGVLYLEEGERYRAMIPELSGGAVPPAPVEGEEQSDPLEAARGRYLEARAWFIERLSLDWRDADARANTELVQRRLAELDEIERQREEQAQDEQQEPQEGEEPMQSDEEGEESSDEEEQPGEDSPENAEGEREPQEPTGDEEQEEQESESEAEDGGEPEEVHLTEEEMRRLLESLRQIEEEGEEVQEALRRVGREGVDRDW